MRKQLERSYFRQDFIYKIAYGTQSAGVILTQSNWCLKNSFRIHFYNDYGVPGDAKNFDLLMKSSIYKLGTWGMSN